MNSRKPSVVSVIMSVFNEEDYLPQAIESILNQTYKDFEFIIVDDASNDTSLEIIKRYASEDKRVAVIENTLNLGLAASLNKALGVAKGEFVARIDADDIAVKDRLEIQLAFLNKNPDIDLVGASMYLIDLEGRTIARSDTTADSKILKKIIYYKNISPHPTWMFRREILKDLKGYRNLPASQDYDFLMRLYSLGYEVSNIDTPLLHYRVHKNKISFDRSITQIKLSRYLRKLYKNDLILDDKYLNKERVSKVTAAFKPVKRIHSLSLSLFEKGRFLMKNSSSISGGILLCISALLSPYMAYFIYCGTRAKLLERNTKLICCTDTSEA